MSNQSPFVDDGTLLIGSSSQGKKKLTGVKSWKPSDEMTREPVLEVGSKRAVGSMVKKGAQSISIEYKPRSRPDVDWATLLNSGETFTISAQYQAGPKKGERWQWSCQVQKFDPPGGDDGGDYSASVELLVIGEGKRMRAGQA